MNGGPQARVSSPSQLSTLMTSAPRSASVCPVVGPANTRASSSTRTPASALCGRVEFSGLSSLALPPPLARRETGVLPDALWRGRGGGGARARGESPGNSPPPIGRAWLDPPPLSSPTGGEEALVSSIELTGAIKRTPAGRFVHGPRSARERHACPHRCSQSRGWRGGASP